MAKQVAAPRDGRGAFLALLVAVVLFLGMLSVETQHFARRAGYQPALGQPVIGKFYAPWASYGWMLRFDLQPNIVAGLLTGQPLMLPRPNESPWVRAAFAAERQRLPWEAGGAFALFIVLSILWTRDRKNSDLHGAAGWATPRDLHRSALWKAQYGIVLGQTKALFGRPGHLLIHNDTQNVLALGPPGEGKTDGIARPTLVKTWRYWSAIVFDPADELNGLTARARTADTQVFIFDPRAAVESSVASTVQAILDRKPRYARFNPLAGIAVGDVDSVRAVLASYFFDRDVSEMSSDARFFESRALALATAVTAHMIELGKPTLEAAARFAVDPAWKSEGALCEALLKSRIPYVQETGAEFARTTERQRAAFIASLNDRLELFRSPDVAGATGASDVSPMDLRRNATTLYLVVREKDQASLNPLMRMVLTRLLHDLTARLPQEGEQHILLMIDEFPLLRAPIIAQQLATMRKYWIHAVLLAQSLAQIRDTYGANETVSGMCDVRVFFPSVDTATQQLASDTCGQTTRWAESMHRDSSGRSSQATSEAGRPLLYPHELADMKANGEIIVYKKGERPIKARPVRAHSDDRFS